MTTYTTFKALADDLAAATLRHPHDPKLRITLATLQDLAQKAWRREQLPLVFDMTHSRITQAIEVGRFGHERQVADPGLAGLRAAWRILSFGAGVNGMEAATFLERPDTAPGEALRKQLKRAAEWAEDVALCPELARTILQIKTAGDTITIKGELPELHLMV